MQKLIMSHHDILESLSLAVGVGDIVDVRRLEREAFRKRNFGGHTNRVMDHLIPDHL